MATQHISREDIKPMSDETAKRLQEKYENGDIDFSDIPEIEIDKLNLDEVKYFPPGTDPFTSLEN